jgi:hypothetical protein
MHAAGIPRSGRRRGVESSQPGQYRRPGALGQLRGRAPAAPRCSRGLTP